MSIKPPPDRDTPTNFAVDLDGRDELSVTEVEAAQKRNGGAPPDLFDIDAIMAWFEGLSQREQSKRLMHLYIALHDEDGAHARRLADHVLEDRQEFSVITDELSYQNACLHLIMDHMGVAPPARPAYRPRRK